MFNIGIIRFSKKIKILDFMVIFIHSKTKKMFLKFWGSKSRNIKNLR